MTGYLTALFATAVPAGRARTAVAETARVVMVRMRRKDMPGPHIGAWTNCLRASIARWTRSASSKSGSDVQSLRPATAVGRRARQHPDLARKALRSREIDR